MLAANVTVLPVKPLLHAYVVPPEAVNDTDEPGHTVADPTTLAAAVGFVAIVNDCTTGVLSHPSAERHTTV